MNYLRLLYRQTYIVVYLLLRNLLIVTLDKIIIVAYTATKSDDNTQKQYMK